MAAQHNDDNRIDLREILRKKQDSERGIHISSATEEIVISTEDVIVDDTYQRHLSEKWAREIAKSFDPEKFGKPKVARRSNGKYAVIDGQHRIAALRIKYPKTRVTFVADLVKTSEGVKTEAKQFLANNASIKKPDTGTVLHALLREGNEDAIAFYQIVEDAGYKVKRGGGRGKPWQVHPYVFKSVSKYCGDTWQQDLRDALHVTRSAWGTDTFPMTSALLTSVALMFRRYRNNPAFDPKHLISRLQRHAAPALAAKGNARAALDSTRQEYGCRTILRDLYNVRLSANNQLPEF